MHSHSRFASQSSMLIQPDYVGLTRRSPHRITLRVYGCGSLLAHICVDHACSFLCMLRMHKNSLRIDGLIQYLFDCLE